MHTGLAVISGTEVRQHAHVALIRGTDSNMAYVFATSPKLAGPAPGPRPAPELARYDKITAGHAAAPGAAAAGNGPGNPLSVLANVLENDGEQLSAARTRQRAPAGAGLLRFLHDLGCGDCPGPRAAVPGAAGGSPAARLPHEPGHRAKWLWRTLRARN